MKYGSFLFFLVFQIAIKAQERVIIYWSGLGEYQWAKRLEKVFINKRHDAILLHAKGGAYVAQEKSVNLEKITPEDIFRIENEYKPTLILELNYAPSSKYAAKRCIFFHHEGIARQQFYFVRNFKRYSFAVAPGSLMQLVGSFCKIPVIEGYPTHQDLGFDEPTFKDIFYCGFLQYDSRRGKGDQMKALMKLSEMDLLSVYGTEKDWELVGRSYKGLLPFEADSVYQAIQDSGIALVLHSDVHYKAGIPTARIFEAAAAGAVIIADKHPFVVKNFGESVFYIDRQADYKKITMQILQHIDRIMKNPDQTRLMAKKANQIFREKFSLDLFVDKLLKEFKCSDN
jgi:glycosyltransferase involved in cell wall biosynthesis